jgi:hypothetical protein
LRELAREIGNRLTVCKIEDIEPGYKFYKLSRTFLPAGPEDIEYLIYPGLRFDLLVVIILAFAPDCYIYITLFFRSDREYLIIFCFSQSIVRIPSELYCPLSCLLSLCNILIFEEIGRRRWAVRLL